MSFSKFMQMNGFIKILRLFYKNNIMQKKFKQQIVSNDYPSQITWSSVVVFLFLF